MTAPFDVLVAVDIRHGQATRLVQADHSSATSYGSADDAIADFVSQEVEWIHLADLDAAFGDPPNDAQLAAARKAHPGKLQISGGIRTASDVARVVKHAPERVVLSAAALADCTEITAMAGTHPGLLWVGIDGRDGGLTARGATDVDLSAVCLDTVIADLNRVPLGGLIVTDVARDGALSGPPLHLLQSVLDIAEHPVVASGGVRDVTDLQALRNLRSPATSSLPDAEAVSNCSDTNSTPAHSRSNPRCLSGVIVGRAFYTGDCSIADAMSVSDSATARTS